MFPYALVVTIVLFGQLRAADERYPLGPSGQAPTGAAANPAETTGKSGLMPLTNSSQPATNGAVGSPSNAPSNSFPTSSGSSSSDNPFRNSSSAGAAQPRTLSPLDSSGASPLNGQSGSVPAQYQERSNVYDSGSAGPSDVTMKPSSMMRAMLVPPAGSQLSGQPTKLVDIVENARSRAEQSQRIEAYWDLCSSVADYYLGLRELQEVQGYARLNPQFWDRVYKNMIIRNETSLRAARASQLRVAGLIGRGSDYLPLPEDAPHCASYNTHHDKIFAQGGPAEARELNALLPLRYTELQSAAVDVKKSENYLDSFAGGRGNPDDGLHALELLALHRRAFVQIARDYNRRISRYSELASPGEVGAVRLTSMLIKTDTASTATKSSMPVPPPNRQSSSQPTPPRTFAEGAAASAGPIANTAKRDEDVQAASANEPGSPTKSTSKKERSLLVAPK
jgi:hypothetical protein